MLEEMLGRPMTQDEKKVIDWLSGWEQSTLDTISRIISEVHAAGVMRGLTGRAGQKMTNDKGWIPVNLSEGANVFWMP